jgi:hypothetical protein
MGYSHGKIWTDELVVSEIKTVMKSLNIDRMPSRNEMDMATRNSGLSNRIAKTGGMYEWAEKIGLDVKDSETKIATKYEEIARDEIECKLNYTAELTPVIFLYDILVEGLTKVDVKVSRGIESGKAFYFTFNLEYRFPKCDFYILYCENERCNKTLIMPAHVMNGKNQISIGIKSIYDKYIDRWDLIESHLKAMSVLAI